VKPSPTPPPPTAPAESPSRERLDSWKEIAAYLQRDERTVRRWEKEEGLPIHRHVHKKLASVYAFPFEIDVWYASRRRALDAPATEQEADQPPEPARRRLSGRWLVTATSALLALGIAGYLGWQRLSRPMPADRVMLVVLPFDNLSGDPEQEYLSDGLTEEMIAQISRWQPGRLGVIARTSAMSYKNARKPVDEIGRELGVDYVLEGSVRRAGDRVRVTAQLIRVSDQSHLWAESYDREIHDVLSLQTDVARRVAREIGARASGPERQPDETVSVDPTAYGAYLKGRYYAHKAQYWSTTRAIGYYEQAIETDPGFAPAHAALAEANVFSFPARETMPRAKASALKALELDPQLAEAHAALGLVQAFWEWDWPAAALSFQRAVEANPGHAEVRQYHSQYLSAMGRWDEALSESRRALELDPLSPRISSQHARVLYLARRFDEAIAQHRKTLELDPNEYWAWFFMGIAYENKGMLTEAIEAIRRSQELSGNKELAADLAEGYTREGYRGALQAWVGNWEKGARRGQNVQWVSVAMLYSRLGDKQKALECLEKAYEERSRALAYLKVEPQFDPLRSEARFQDLLRKMRLAG
jgi:TolB-like protein/Flp pilus assembly protein TadD